jgi:hypothetical protein
MRHRLDPQSRAGSAKLTLHYIMALLVFIFGCTTAPLRGQEAISPPPQPRSGLQLLTVSGYAAYYPSGLPTTGSLQQGAANLGSDLAEGGSATIGWSKFTDRSTFAMTYTPAYTGRVRYSSVNAFNHAFSLNTTRKIAPRWTFGFSVRGDFSSLEQAFFAPTTLSSAVSAPATFENLAAAFTGARFTNPELASIVTSAPLVESPLRTLLYGQRMFTSGMQTNFSYSSSPRLSFTFLAGANRSQHVSENALGANDAFLLPTTTSGTAGVTVSYSLSPLTQLSGNLNTARTSSAFEDVYTTISTVSLGHTFTRRWFLQVHGGLGIIHPVRQTSFLLTTRPRPIAGGSLGFKTFSHTVLGSFDRTVSDSYGLGAGATSSATLTWSWRRPGRVWWFESSLGWQQLQGNILTSTSGWNTTASLGRRLSNHIIFLTQYAYLKYSGGLQTAISSLSQSAARVSIVWNAQPSPSQ